MPKYILLFIGNDEAAKDWKPEDLQRVYAKAGEWFGANQAVPRGGEELKSHQTAKTLRRKGYRPEGAVVVTDGPFIESKEQVGGFAIAELPDMRAAIELAKTWPTGGTVEVREIVTH